MFDFLQKGTEINTTQIVDEIEAAVYVHVRPYGFKKYGRTLHRFVSEDISQVIMTAPFAPAWEQSAVNRKPGHNNGLTGICPAQIRLHTAVLLFGHDAQKLTLFL